MIEETKKQIVKTIQKKNSKKNIKASPELTLMHLVEEVGELSSAMINKKMNRKEIDNNLIGHQIADCIADLMLLSDQFEINLDNEIKNWEEKIKR